MHPRSLLYVCQGFVLIRSCAKFAGRPIRRAAQPAGRIEVALAGITDGHKTPARPRRGQGREAILSAVARIVAREGIDGVTFRSVAAEAGVSPGLASYHFATRDEMLQEAMTWAVHDAIQELAGMSDGRSPSLLRNSVDFVAAKPDEMAFQFETIFHGRRSASLSAHVREMYETYFAAVQESLRNAGLAGDRRTAKLVLAVMDGLAVQELVFEDPADAAATAELFQEMLAAHAQDRDTP
jgi:TetR/AcrR family transcriptional regulator, regulator of biofilm formation and stress response